MNIWMYQTLHFISQEKPPLRLQVASFFKIQQSQLIFQTQKIKKKEFYYKVHKDVSMGTQQPFHFLMNLRALKQPVDSILQQYSSSLHEIQTVIQKKNQN